MSTCTCVLSSLLTDRGGGHGVYGVVFLRGAVERYPANFCGPAPDSLLSRACEAASSDRGFNDLFSWA